MYFTPLDYMVNNYHAQITQSYIRVFHASPNTHPVDVYLNNNLTVQNLAYRGFSEYLPIPSGNYNVKIYPAGQRINPIIDTTLSIAPNSIYTISAIGQSPNISLYPILDPAVRPDPSRANVRFSHLSPNTPNVDITLPNGTRLFSNIAYRGVTSYVPMNPGTYTLQARAAGTNSVILNVPNIQFKPNKNYTIYAVGLSGATPPLQVLIPLDGSSYIRV